MPRLRSRLTLPGAALLATLALAGCGSSTSSTAPGAAITQDVADEIALQSVTALDLSGQDMQQSFMTMAGAPAPRSARPMSVVWDTTITAGSVTYTAHREFYDADGGTLPQYGPTAVRMTWDAHAWGVDEMPRDTLTLAHWGAFQMRGISPLEDTLKVDGTVADTLLNHFRSYDGLRMRDWSWVSGLDIAAVRFLKSTLGSGAWPLSGTATFVVSADRLRSNQRTDVEAHYDATVVVTFNGTHQPDVVVNGTWHYKWNLDTGVVTRA